MTLRWVTRVGAIVGVATIVAWGSPAMAADPPPGWPLGSSVTVRAKQNVDDSGGRLGTATVTVAANLGHLYGTDPYHTNGVPTQVALDLRTTNEKPLPVSCFKAPAPDTTTDSKGRFSFIVPVGCDGPFHVEVTATGTDITGDHNFVAPPIRLDYLKPADRPSESPQGDRSTPNNGTTPSAGDSGGVHGGSADEPAPDPPEAPSSPSVDAPNPPSVPNAKSKSTSTTRGKPHFDRTNSGRARAASAGPRESGPGHGASSSLNARLLFATIAGSMLATLVAAIAFLINRRAKQLDEHLPPVS